MVSSNLSGNLVGNYSGFRVELREPGIALLTFDEPARLNGMHVDTKRDFIEALTQVQVSDDARRRRRVPRETQAGLQPEEEVKGK